MRNFTSTHRLSLACIAALALAAPACGDSSNNDGAEGASAGTAETGADSADAAETSAGSMSGDGDGDSGDGDGDSGDGDGDTGDGDGDTGDGDGDTGDGDGDTGDGDGDGDTGSACAGYETADDCDADPACMSLMGQQLQENGPDAPCLQPLDFQGCIDMQGCGDALTWFCVGGNMKPVLMSSTCGPDGAEMCDPGVQDPPACP